MPHRQKKLRIAIVGAGFGGLSLAVALKPYPDIDVQIFERASDFVPMAGAGMSVWPRTVSILKKWGIDQSFRNIVTQSQYPDLAFQMSLSNSPRPGRIFHTWKLPGGLHSFHRAKFMEVLAAVVPQTPIHFGQEFKSYTQDADGVTIHLSSGDSYTFDLLIACDGLWSSVRMQMYKELHAKYPEADPTPRWTGTAVFRALIPYSRLLALEPNHKALKAPQMYCGKSLRVLCYPMNQGTYINFVAFFSNPSQERTSYEEAWRWQPEVRKSFLEEAFKDWELEVTQLVSLITDTVGPPGPTRWPVYALKPLPKFVHGRVVLLGDAAHATTPHWGFGACSSVEDANILATLLGDGTVTKASLGIALSIYDKMRVAEGRRIIEGSKQAGLVYEMNGPMGDNLPAVSDMVQKMTAWISNTSPGDDVQNALKMLYGAIRN